MEQTLREHFQTHSCQGFKPVPHYSPLGDFVTWFFRDDRAYEERVDELLTVYLSMKTGDLVGCKIEGVRKLLQTAGDFGVTLDTDVRLGFFLFIGAVAAKDAKQKQRYQELARIAKDTSVARAQLLAAQGS